MIIAANWKMNPSLDIAGSLVSALNADSFQPVKLILFVPHPFLMPISVHLGKSDIRLGGQDCHQEAGGAHTGDVAAEMLKDCGASIVLLGHSERRKNHGEKSEQIASKAHQALAQGLDIMICVGETLSERQAGQAEQIVIDQLRSSVPNHTPQGQLMIAYEPVWAIGTGKVPSLPEIAKMHSAIASELNKLYSGKIVGSVPILYGGSVNRKNAAAILSLNNVDGGLIGGASLDSAAFGSICDIARAQVSKPELNP